MPKIYSSPSFQFEQLSGLTGIHTPWKTPGGRSYADIEAEMDPLLELLLFNNGSQEKLKAGVERLRGIFDSFAELNPELNALRDVKEQPFILVHALYGITSQFNLSDIEYFLGSSTDEKVLNKKLVRMENLSVLAFMTPIDWLPSEKTLDCIFAQIPDPSREAKIVGSLLSLGGWLEEYKASSIYLSLKKETRNKLDTYSSSGSTDSMPWRSLVKYAGSVILKKRTREARVALRNEAKRGASASKPPENKPL
ncbi:MAG: hypothetical protein PHE27_06250 [Alphaproteobacteria bacterium]|nr:hypothetical protein [Alphaproteobacteria bacterium]